MYKIYIKNYIGADSPATESLLDSSDLFSNEENRTLLDPTVKNELNKAGSLEFTLLPGNPFYDKIMIVKSILSVWLDDELIFRGRVMSMTDDIHKQREVFCEGELAYLNDSIQPPRTTSNANVPEYLEALLKNHNAQMDTIRGLADEYPQGEDNKHFYYGHGMTTWPSGAPTEIDFGLGSNTYMQYRMFGSQVVTQDSVSDSGSTLHREILDETTEFNFQVSGTPFKSTSYRKTIDAIQSDLLDSYGGYITVHYEMNPISGKEERHLHYGRKPWNSSSEKTAWLAYASPNTATSQNPTISFGVNLQELSQEKDASDIYSVLLPIGDNNLLTYGIKTSKVPTYADIYDRPLDAIKKYGPIVKTQSFSGIRNRKELKLYSRNYISKMFKGVDKSYTIKAIDMHFVDNKHPLILVGSTCNITLWPGGSEEERTIERVCSSVTYELQNPENNEFVFEELSDEPKTLTSKYRRERSSSSSTSTTETTTTTDGETTTESVDLVLRSAQGNIIMYPATGKSISIPDGTTLSAPKLTRFELGGPTYGGVWFSSNKLYVKATGGVDITTGTNTGINATSSSVEIRPTLKVYDAVKKPGNATNKFNRLGGIFASGESVFEESVHVRKLIIGANTFVSGSDAQQSTTGSTGLTIRLPNGKEDSDTSYDIKPVPFEIYGDSDGFNPLVKTWILGKNKINFNIADTGWFKSKVSAIEKLARDSVVISGYTWGEPRQTTVNGETRYSIGITVNRGYASGIQGDETVYTNIGSPITIPSTNITSVYTDGYENGWGDAAGKFGIIQSGTDESEFFVAHPGSEADPDLAPNWNTFKIEADSPDSEGGYAYVKIDSYAGESNYVLAKVDISNWWTAAQAAITGIDADSFEAGQQSIQATNIKYSDIIGYKISDGLSVAINYTLDSTDQNHPIQAVEQSATIKMPVIVLASNDAKDNNSSNSLNSSAWVALYKVDSITSLWTQVGHSYLRKKIILSHNTASNSGDRVVVRDANNKPSYEITVRGTVPADPLPLSGEPAFESGRYNVAKKTVTVTPTEAIRYGAQLVELDKTDSTRFYWTPRNMDYPDPEHDDTYCVGTKGRIDDNGQQADVYQYLSVTATNARIERGELVKELDSNNLENYLDYSGSYTFTKVTGTGIVSINGDETIKVGVEPASIALELGAPHIDGQNGSFTWNNDTHKYEYLVKSFLNVGSNKSVLTRTVGPINFDAPQAVWYGTRSVSLDKTDSNKFYWNNSNNAYHVEVSGQKDNLGNDVNGQTYAELAVSASSVSLKKTFTPDSNGYSGSYSVSKELETGLFSINGDGTIAAPVISLPINLSLDAPKTTIGVADTENEARTHKSWDIENHRYQFEIASSLKDSNEIILTRSGTIYFSPTDAIRYGKNSVKINAPTFSSVSEYQNYKQIVATFNTDAPTPYPYDYYLRLRWSGVWSADHKKTVTLSTAHFESAVSKRMDVEIDASDVFSSGTDNVGIGGITWSGSSNKVSGRSFSVSTSGRASGDISRAWDLKIDTDETWAYDKKQNGEVQDVYKYAYVSAKESADQEYDSKMRLKIDGKPPYSEGQKSVLPTIEADGWKWQERSDTNSYILYNKVTAGNPNDDKKKNSTFVPAPEINVVVSNENASALYTDSSNATHTLASTPHTLFRDGQNSVTVTSIERVMDCAFDSEDGTATQNVQLTLSNGVTQIFEDESFDDVYRAGQNGEPNPSPIQYAAYFDRDEPYDMQDELYLDCDEIYEEGRNSRHNYRYVGIVSARSSNSTTTVSIRENRDSGSRVVFNVRNFRRILCTIKPWECNITTHGNAAEHDPSAWLPVKYIDGPNGEEYYGYMLAQHIAFTKAWYAYRQLKSRHSSVSRYTYPITISVSRHGVKDSKSTYFRIQENESAEEGYIWQDYLIPHINNQYMAKFIRFYDEEKLNALNSEQRKAEALLYDPDDPPSDRGGATRIGSNQRYWAGDLMNLDFVKEWVPVMMKVWDRIYEKDVIYFGYVKASMVYGTGLWDYDPQSWWDIGVYVNDIVNNYMDVDISYTLYNKNRSGVSNPPITRTSRYNYSTYTRWKKYETLEQGSNYFYAVKDDSKTIDPAVTADVVAFHPAQDDFGNPITRDRISHIAYITVKEDDGTVSDHYVLFTSIKRNYVNASPTNPEASTPEGTE